MTYFELILILSPFEKPSFFRSRDKKNVFAAGATGVRVAVKVPPEERPRHFSGQAVGPGGESVDRADVTLECSPGEPTYYNLGQPGGQFSCSLPPSSAP